MTISTPYILPPELAMFRQTVRKMAREKVEPRAAEIDRRAEYPEDMFRLLREQELLGIAFPEAYGGSGQGVLALCLAIEELARVCCNTALLLVVSHVPGFLIETAGSEEQRNHYLPKLAAGEVRGCFAATEPAAGSDLNGIQTRAVREGDTYRLNGSKCFISGATVADFAIVVAKTEQGLSLFIVPTRTPGFALGKNERKLGARGVPTSEIFLEDCRVPRESLLGQEGKGASTILRALTRMRPAIGARGVGLAQGALDYAVKYARERVAYGKPIAELQGLQFMLAEMAMKIEASRQLVYHAASMVDSGNCGKEFTGLLSMSKCFPTDVAMEVAVEAVQVLGAYGICEDYPLERFLRDAKTLQIVEGTNQVQRMLVARALLGKQ